MPGVMFGYVHAGGVRAEFLNSVVDLLGSEAGELIGATGHASAGTEIAVARNILAAQFLEQTDCEWLWTVDTDMVFSPSALTGLYATATADYRPVVSALAMILDARYGPMPSVYSRHGPAVYERETQIEPGVLIPAGGVGAACLLVHRNVFEAIAAECGPVWFNHIPAEPVQLSEDLSFCERVHAAGCGICVDTRVRVGHMKPIMVGDVT